MAPGPDTGGHRGPEVQVAWLVSPIRRTGSRDLRVLEAVSSVLVGFIDQCAPTRKGQPSVCEVAALAEGSRPSSIIVSRTKPQPCPMCGENRPWSAPQVMTNSFVPTAVVNRIHGPATPAEFWQPPYSRGRAQGCTPREELLELVSRGGEALEMLRPCWTTSMSRADP